VFEAETRIAARVFALQALVNAKSCVNANVAVGVRAGLPSGEMRFEAVRVQLLLGHHENAVVVRKQPSGLKIHGESFRLSSRLFEPDW